MDLVPQNFLEDGLSVLFLLLVFFVQVFISSQVDFSCCIHSWEPICKYINEQYEKFLKEEVNITRKKRIPDTRVHCCLYFISPTGHAWVNLYQSYT